LPEPETGFGILMPDGTRRCTGRTVGGPVFAYVKDGKIVRVTPIEFGPDDAWRSFYLNSIPDEVVCFPISIRGLCCVV